MAGDVAGYRGVVDMLGIDTILLDTLATEHGFVVEEIAETVAKDKAAKLETVAKEKVEKEQQRRKQEEGRRKKKEDEKRREKDEERSNKRKRESLEVVKQSSIEAAKAQMASRRGSMEVKAASKAEVKDEEIEIIGSETKAEVERFTCPFPDCSSESRTAQSIKVEGRLEQG